MISDHEAIKALSDAREAFYDLQGKTGKDREWERIHDLVTEVADYVRLVRIMNARERGDSTLTFALHDPDVDPHVTDIRVRR